MAQDRWEINFVNDEKLDTVFVEIESSQGILDAVSEAHRQHGVRAIEIVSCKKQFGLDKEVVRMFEKVRKKLTNKQGKTKTRIAYQCSIVKLGSVPSAGYFLEEPVQGKMNQYVECGATEDATYIRAIEVLVDNVNGSAIFCSTPEKL